jgi:hypothetical protein
VSGMRPTFLALSAEIQPAPRPTAMMPVVLGTTTVGLYSPVTWFVVGSISRRMCAAGAGRRLGRSARGDSARAPPVESTAEIDHELRRKESGESNESCRTVRAGATPTRQGDLALLDDTVAQGLLLSSVPAVRRTSGPAGRLETYRSGDGWESRFRRRGRGRSRHRRRSSCPRRRRGRPRLLRGRNQCCSGTSPSTKRGRSGVGRSELKPPPCR